MKEKEREFETTFRMDRSTYVKFLKLLEIENERGTKIYSLDKMVEERFDYCFKSMVEDSFKANSKEVAELEKKWAHLLETEGLSKLNREVFWLNTLLVK